jgi:hypothetical protein
MKTSYQFTITKIQKSKKPKKAAKTVSATYLAQQYSELQRLRARISEAEAWRNAR